jgi:hypothetical protein
MLRFAMVQIVVFASSRITSSMCLMLVVAAQGKRKHKAHLSCFRLFLWRTPVDLRECPGASLVM